MCRDVRFLDLDPDGMVPCSAGCCYLPSSSSSGGRCELSIIDADFGSGTSCSSTDPRSLGADAGVLTVEHRELHWSPSTAEKRSDSARSFTSTTIERHSPRRWPPRDRRSWPSPMVRTGVPRRAIRHATPSRGPSVQVVSPRRNCGSRETDGKEDVRSDPPDRDSAAVAREVLAGRDREQSGGGPQDGPQVHPRGRSPPEWRRAVRS